MSRPLILIARAIAPQVVDFLRGTGQPGDYNPSTVVDGIFSITNIIFIR